MADVAAGGGPGNVRGEAAPDEARAPRPGAGSGPGQAEPGGGEPGPGELAGSPPVAANGKRGVRYRVRHGTEVAKGKYAGSSAEHLWRRLDSMDFINRGLLFAATLLLCLFPFLIVANALAGRSAASGLARHLGLDKQAAADVGGLFTSSAATSSAVTGTAWVFFILGGIAAATAIQELYERAFELDGRGARDILRRLVWLAVLVGGSILAGWAGPGLRGAGGASSCRSRPAGATTDTTGHRWPRASRSIRNERRTVPGRISGGRSLAATRSNAGRPARRDRPCR